MHTIDQEAFKELGVEIGHIVRDYLKPPPHNADRVFTILNVLAGVAGVIIAGAENNSDEVLAWFHAAVRNEVDGIKDDDAAAMVRG